MIWSDTFSKYLFLCLWHSSKGYYGCFLLILPFSPGQSLLSVSNDLNTLRAAEKQLCSFTHYRLRSWTWNFSFFIKEILLFFSFVSKKVTNLPTTHSQSCTYIRELYTPLCVPPLPAFHIIWLLMLRSQNQSLCVQRGCSLVLLADQVVLNLEGSF